MLIILLVCLGRLSGKQPFMQNTQFKKLTMCYALHFTVFIVDSLVDYQQHPSTIKHKLVKCGMYNICLGQY